MLYLFNTTIIPNEGIYSCRPVSTAVAGAILQEDKFPVSAIGHQGSADALNAIFPDLNVQVNRIPAVMEQGDSAICLKLKGRLPEGEIISYARMLEIGFDLFFVKRLPDTVLGDCYCEGASASNHSDSPNDSMKDLFGI